MHKEDIETMKTPKRQSVPCNIQVETILDSSIRGDVFLRPNTEYKLTIDYPLSTPATVTIRSGRSGMGTNVLLDKICKAYLKIYESEDRFLARYGTTDKESPYGIWGHSISDLAIEGIDVNHVKKTIRLDVGS